MASSPSDSYDTHDARRGRSVPGRRSGRRLLGAGRRWLGSTADALADPLRGFAYGPPIEPAPPADPATSLLNYLGRRADWTP